MAEGGPLQRVADAIGKAVLRLPVEQSYRSLDAGIGARHVARSPFGVLGPNRRAGYVVEGIKELTDGRACARAQVDRDGCAHRGQQGVEPAQRHKMRRGKIPDMNVVSDT